MKPRPFLRSAEPADLGGNGPSAVVLPVEEAPAAAVAEETPAAAVEPTFLQRASAAFASKSAILAERDTFRTRAETAEAESLTLRAQVLDLGTQLAAVLAEREEISALLDTATAENQAVEAAAASQVAALGFEPAALPSASAAPEETRATLVAQIEKETDPKKLWALTERYEALSN